jgi:MHS family proline/betaine transporter-like MFS transporter
MLQGFSVGGQLVSSLVYTCENKPRSRWGFYGSFVLASANFGTLLGGIVAFYIRSSLNDDQLHEFGWRIPFLSGIIICMFGIYLRYFCDDDEVIHTNTSSAPSNPLAGAFALKNLRVLVSVSLVPMLWAGGFYITFVWMAIFMEKIVEPPVPQAFAVNSSALFLSVCTLLPIAGSLSDSFGRKRMMFIGCIFLACVCPGLVIFISEGVSSAVTNNRSVNAFFAQVIMGTFLSCFAGPSKYAVENID